MAEGDSTTPSVEYRDVVGFPDYRVGDDGSVWSRKSGVWKRLATQSKPKGHLIVKLRRDGKYHHRYVHRMVLESFTAPCPAGMECRHFPDRDPTNNHLSNLQWGSQAENCADTIVHGTRIRGERVGSARLTADQVKKIRERVLAGERQGDIALEFSVSPMTISDIMRYATWRHLI